jgi:hypothetical protein
MRAIFKHLGMALLSVAVLITFSTQMLSCQQRALGLAVQTKTFQQQVSEAVDILFVIDNSLSLVEEVEKVRDGMTAFVDALVDSNADFQLGVVTMNVRSQINTGLSGDDQSGLLQIAPTVISTDPDTQPYFTSDADPDDVVADLQATLDFIETDPSKTDDVLGKGCEAGLEAARLAIDGSINQNPGFVRENTNLAIIFISDEDDTSITAPDAIAEADDNCNDFRLRVIF